MNPKIVSVGLAFFSFLLNAQSFIASPQEVSRRTRVQYEGTFGEHTYGLRGTMVSGELEWDPEEDTVTFRSLTADINDTVNMSKSFEVNGEELMITGSVTLDSEIVIVDDNPIPISSRTEDRLEISGDDFRINSIPNTQQNRLIGSYSFSGPTESMSGDFVIDDPSWRRRVNNPAGDDVSLFIDVTQFQRRLTVDPSSEINPNFLASRPTGLDHEIFAGTIDGVDLSVIFDWIRIDTAIPQKYDLIRSFTSAPRPLHSFSFIELGGTFGDHNHPISGSSIGMQVDLNDADLTTTFREVTIDIDETINLIGHQTIMTGGFGEPMIIGTNIFTGTIEFDSTLRFLDDESLSTTLVSHNQFRIEDFKTDLGQSDLALLTGIYTLSGPTETVDGTFEISLDWTRQGNPVIDVEGFPDSVTLTETVGWRDSDFESSIPLFTRTVDGVEITVNLSGTTQFFTPNNYNLFIPEPSTYAIVGGICLVGFVAFRRIRISKSS